MSTLSKKGLVHLPQGIKAFSSSISLLTDLLRGETLVWKLLMLKSASAYVNRRIHAVKAETLILSSGRDHLLPSKEEGKRLLAILPNCDIRKFSHSGHMLLLQEDGIDLATIMKAANFYRRARSVDYSSDYMPPSPSEFRKLQELNRWLELAASPVLISTLENGKMVRGLEGIPSEGPVLYVANHMLLALDVLTPLTSFWAQRNIHLRGMAHALWFARLRDGRLHDLSKKLDVFRTMGFVPVTAANFYKFLSSKSHVLLYPGGVREALHRKGEEYKLFWPEQSQFVRVAATLGATIVPFGAVGEDDIGQVFLDYNDQMKIPYLKAEIEELNDKLRIDIDGEDGNQVLHIPLVAPKIPGRFYFFFGKPIKTEGRELELRNKDKAQELYLEVKSEVERCIAYLLEKRKNDPYRNIVPRLFYQATHGFDCKVPTFEL